MYELINAVGAKERIEREDFERYWPSMITTLENSVFKGRLAKVSEKEREVLIKISMRDELMVSPSMIKSVKGAPEFFSRLEQKGLLLKRERGQYQLFHPLFRDYLKKIATKT
jgi:ATP/maltotriose-dependent transcriptional regulator MalT